MIVLSQIMGDYFKLTCLLISIALGNDQHTDYMRNRGSCNHNLCSPHFDLHFQTGNLHFVEAHCSLYTLLHLDCD